MFDIGDFNFTPISYQNLLLHTKDEENNPTPIGPALIHEEEEEEEEEEKEGNLLIVLRDAKTFEARTEQFVILWHRQRRTPCEGL